VSSVLTEGISLEEENFLWLSGVLNVDSPKALLSCVFYQNGKEFFLEGDRSTEICVLYTQLKRFYNPDKYVYTERASKNCPGGLMQLELQHKLVNIYANSDVGERCHVFVWISTSLSYNQQQLKRIYFYCKPKDVVPADPSVPWYCCTCWKQCFE
jgi:hypothetical protein